MAKKKNSKKSEDQQEIDVINTSDEVASDVGATDEKSTNVTATSRADISLLAAEAARQFLEGDDNDESAMIAISAEAFELANSDIGFAEIDSEEEATDSEPSGATSPIDDTELGAYESAEIEEIEKLSDEQISSIVESLLFATDKPQSVAMLKAAFQGTHVRSADIRAALAKLELEFTHPQRGVMLVEAAGGYQLRTKTDNQTFLARTIKARPFRVSGPALEVLAIVAYKQPCTKSQVDEIRGVESGHLMRGLLDRGLMQFGEKSELPGRPMFYETTRKFLEIFGLRNLSELPSLNEIDQLIPEGIGEVAEEKETLSDLTGQLSTEVVAKSYSEGEDELLDISSELQTIQTSTDFFEQEKLRQKQKRDAERAQDIRERLAVGEEVEERDKRWLAKYEISLNPPVVADAVVEVPEVTSVAAETTAAEVEVHSEAPESVEGEV